MSVELKAKKILKILKFSTVDKIEQLKKEEKEKLDFLKADEIVKKYENGLLEPGVEPGDFMVLLKDGYTVSQIMMATSIAIWKSSPE